MGFFDRFNTYYEDRALARMVEGMSAAELTEAIIKATDSRGDFWDQPTIVPKREWDDPDEQRRAISSVSNYYNSLGVYRSDFNRAENDKFARNAYYAICEKGILDYMRTVPWRIVDKSGDELEDEMEWLRYPNPQETFTDVTVASLRDLIRYDAGVVVKTFRKSGYVGELKAYPGTEFWKEIDRSPRIVKIPDGQHYVGYWSYGYTQRYWQRSRTGLYISFEPDEIAYMCMYKPSDGIYGTDYLKFMKHQIQYLIDSTRAAGKTFANGVVPSIVWEHPSVFTVPQLFQRMQEVKTSNQGSFKFGGVLHTIRDEKVTTLAQKLHDMEWLEGQKFIAQLVWAMWGFSPQEFVGQDANRATAYISRNITKSRMLYPLMEYYATIINREVLPYRKGWKKDWRFEFVRDVDLDDEQKLAVTRQTNANAVATLVQVGVDVQDALKWAGIGDNLRTQNIERPLQVNRSREAPLGDTQPGGHVEGYKGRKNPEPTSEIEDTDNSKFKRGNDKKT